MKYVNTFLFLFILIFRDISFASAAIMECYFSNSKYIGVISLDAISQQGMMRFKPKNEPSDSHWISCPLFVYDIKDLTKEVSPMIHFVFYKGLCESVPKDFNLDILTNHIVLYLNLWNERDIKAYIKWLKEYHRDACYIDTINLYFIRLIIRKFKIGTWGRGFAINTKSLGFII